MYGGICLILCREYFLMRRVSLLICVLVGKCGNCLGGCGEVCYVCSVWVECDRV